MKYKIKSAIFAAFCAALALSLSACEESSSVPHVFGGVEVPKDVLNEPRLVSTPSQADLNGKAWPRLGDIPSKPQNFSPQPVINQAVKEMQYDRTQAEEEKQQYESATAPPASSPETYP